MSHTKGPWAWFGNANHNQIYLATTHSGRRYVMGFKRWGFSGAQPQFQPRGSGLVDASELLEFAVGDPSVRGFKQAKSDGSVYRYDVSGIDCADARLIAAAPDLLEAAEAVVKQWDTPNWKLTEHTATFINALRAAIAKATGAA